MKRIGLYIRVSTREQAESGWSIEGQYKELREYCDKQDDWKVCWVIKDPGFTGANLERPGIERLLTLVQCGGLDTLLVWRYDRISRDNVDFTALLHLLNKSNVEVQSVQEPSLDYTSPHGEFIIGILGLVSTLERKTIQVRVKMGMKTRAQKGLWHGGTPPYGYDYDKSTGKLTINPDEATTVKTIFKTYLKLRSLNRVKQYLLENSLTKRTGAHFTVQGIRHILRRERYLGNVESLGIRIDDPTLKVITTQTFQKTQHILDGEKITGVLEDEIDIPNIHIFPDKHDHPQCPQCRRKLTVRRRGYRIHKDGELAIKYSCSACERHFDSKTVQYGIPHCPKCRSQDKVQYLFWKVLERQTFLYFRCRPCKHTLRVPLRPQNNLPGTSHTGDSTSSPPSHTCCNENNTPSSGKISS